ncbi:hypothetical protein Tco_0190017 [Tanacetum coccineum]
MDKHGVNSKKRLDIWCPPRHMLDSILNLLPLVESNIETSLKNAPDLDRKMKGDDAGVQTNVSSLPKERNEERKRMKVKSETRMGRVGKILVIKS